MTEQEALRQYRRWYNSELERLKKDPRYANWKSDYHSLLQNDLYRAGNQERDERGWVRPAEFVPSMSRLKSEYAAEDDYAALAPLGKSGLYQNYYNFLDPDTLERQLNAREATEIPVQKDYRSISNTQKVRWNSDKNRFERAYYHNMAQLPEQMRRSVQHHPYGWVPIISGFEDYVKNNPEQQQQQQQQPPPPSVTENITAADYVPTPTGEYIPARQTGYHGLGDTVHANHPRWNRYWENRDKDKYPDE